MKTNVLNKTLRVAAMANARQEAKNIPAALLLFICQSKS
jgi:hypothetical protein